MKKVLFLVVLSAIVASCGSSKSETQKNATQAAITPVAAPAIATEDLMIQRGRVLYEQNCQNCHKLPDPTAKTDEKWKRIMPIMAAKAKIDTPAADSISAYVFAVRGANH